MQICETQGKGAAFLDMTRHDDSGGDDTETQLILRIAQTNNPPTFFINAEYKSEFVLLLMAMRVDLTHPTEESWSV